MSLFVRSGLCVKWRSSGLFGALRAGRHVSDAFGIAGGPLPNGTMATALPPSLTSSRERGLRFDVLLSHPYLILLKPGMPGRTSRFSWSEKRISPSQWSAVNVGEHCKVWGSRHLNPLPP